MNKILIADDEPLIRKGLITKIKKLGFSFTDYLEAKNGNEAISIIEQQLPNIILMDIHMPFVNGIDAIRNLSDRFPNLIFIIISGYAEFSYAQEAINLGVNSYILKPVQDANLFEALKKAIFALENQKESYDIKVKSESLENDKKYFEMEKNINKIFKSTEKVVIGSVLVNNHILNNTMLCVLHVGNRTENNEFDSLEIKNIFINEFKQNFGLHTHPIEHSIFDNYLDKSELLLLISGEELAILKTQIHQVLLSCINKILNSYHYPITVGISSIFEYLSQDMYEQAREALHLKTVIGSCRIYYYEECTEAAELSELDQKLYLLDRSLQHLDLNDARNRIESIFKQSDITNKSAIYIRTLWVKVIGIIYKAYKDEKDLSICKEIGSLSKMDFVYENFTSMNEIAEYLIDLINDMVQYDSSIASLDSIGIIQNIKKYIEVNYMEDITVKSLAEKFSLNVSYLSTLFKKVTGVTIIKFITNIRIGHACEMLSNTRSSISMISQQVGYSDIQYFFRVFKKNVQKTPLEFRQML